MAATAVAVSNGGTIVAMETVAATNPNQGIGPATIVAPTISQAGRRATSADLTPRSVVAIGAAATAADPGNNVLSEAGTAVDHDKTVISEKKAEERATVVAAIAEARGKTVVAVGRAAFDQKGPSVRHKASLVGTLTTVGQNPSADRAVMTIDGGPYG